MAQGKPDINHALTAQGTDVNDPYDNLPEFSHQHIDDIEGPPSYSATSLQNQPRPELTPNARQTTLPSVLHNLQGNPPEVRITTLAKEEISDRSLVTAYILACGLGFLGAHHFYMKRPRFGILYIFSLGLLGLGWLTDICRLPGLVKRANSKLKDPASYFSGPEDRDTFYVYLMWLPFGLLGVHQYYLRRWKWALLYTFTFGIFTIGWLIDIVRIPRMTRDCNQALEDDRNNVREHGPSLKTIATSYLLALPPVGIFGGHHYYMNRRGFGVLYSLTAGLFLVGWLADLCRMSYLVKRVNAKLQQDYNTASGGHLVTADRTKNTDDAYVLHCSPFGIFGAGHFYLGRYRWGVAYLFTFGFLLVGWIIDMFRLARFVREINAAESSDEHQIHIQYRGDAQIIVITDGEIIAEAATGARTPVVLPITGVNHLAAEDPPPSYESVLSQT